MFPCIVTSLLVEEHTCNQTKPDQVAQYFLSFITGFALQSLYLSSSSRTWPRLGHLVRAWWSRVRSPYGPFTLEMDHMTLLGSFQFRLFCGWKICTSFAKIIWLRTFSMQMQKINAYNKGHNKQTQIHRADRQTLDQDKIKTSSVTLNYRWAIKKLQANRRLLNKVKDLRSGILEARGWDYEN